MHHSANLVLYYAGETNRINNNDHRNKGCEHDCVYVNRLVLRGTTDFAPRYVPSKNTAVLGSTVVINH